MLPDWIIGFVFQWHIGGYLWVIETGQDLMVGGEHADDYLPDTDTTKEYHSRVMAWYDHLEDYHDEWDTDIFPRPPEAPLFDYKKFDAEGITFAQEFASRIGPDYYVAYRAAQTGPGLQETLWQSKTIPDRVANSEWYDRLFKPRPNS